MTLFSLWKLYNEISYPWITALHRRKKNISKWKFPDSFSLWEKLDEKSFFYGKNLFAAKQQITSMKFRWKENSWQDKTKWTNAWGKIDAWSETNSTFVRKIYRKNAQKYNKYRKKAERTSSANSRTMYVFWIRSKSMGILKEFLSNFRLQ